MAELQMVGGTPDEWWLGRDYVRQGSCAMSTTTQKWLANNVQAYANSDRVYADVDAALRRFPTLRPKSDVYSSVLRLTLIPVLTVLPSVR